MIRRQRRRRRRLRLYKRLRSFSAIERLLATLQISRVSGAPLLETLQVEAHRGSSRAVEMGCRRYFR